MKFPRTPPAEETELKDCRFCGGPALEWGAVLTFAPDDCGYCGFCARCGTGGPVRRERQEAVDLWNGRPPEQDGCIQWPGGRPSPKLMPYPAKALYAQIRKTVEDIHATEEGPAWWGSIAPVYRFRFSDLTRKGLSPHALDLVRADIGAKLVGTGATSLVWEFEPVAELQYSDDWREAIVVVGMRFRLEEDLM